MRTALIAGGGIGGLASALALRATGWRVEVFERAADLKAVGAGLALWTNGLRALDRLGVGRAIREAGVPNSDGWIRTSAGEGLVALSNAELRARFGEVGMMLHRADVHEVLLAALGRDVRTGAELVAVREEGERVTAVFADGGSATGDVLVGADGIHSMVRAALHGRLPLRYAGYTAWRAVIDFPYERLLPGESWGRGLRFGQAPVRDGRAYIFATANTPEGARAESGEAAELVRLFGDWHDPIPEIVRGLSDDVVLRNDIYDLPPLRSWGRGRITLLGDAAHPMTPNLGQGACQALEDAVVLGRWLEHATDVPIALRGYEAERRPRASSFVRRSRDVGRVGQWSHPLAVRVRDGLARRLLPRMQPGQIAEMAAVEL
jgi:2-polyprenyl-6-methoxyphenol hydroxylase-like FAD-dependent oxidoreductase